MDILKKLFPLSFKMTGSVANLVIGVILYLVIGIIGGAALAIVGLIPLPLLGTLLGIVGALIDLYVVGGIVVMFLSHFKVLKD